jgi:hypothetical protein
VPVASAHKDPGIARIAGNSGAEQLVRRASASVLGVTLAAMIERSSAR